tara:strand:- start:11657 stop:12007 length:351 start_codon:yes stop_codon:yes gene_type:complete
MTKLTTHVLDVFSGKPGKGIKVELFFLDGENKEKLSSVILNNDGRSEGPLVENENFKNGKYELIFFIGDYFKKISKQDELQFLDDVVVRFSISNNKENYHVPLLVSPWSYTTYRGS